MSGEITCQPDGIATKIKLVTWPHVSQVTLATNILLTWKHYTYLFHSILSGGLHYVLQSLLYARSHLKERSNPIPSLAVECTQRTHMVVAPSLQRAQSDLSVPVVWFGPWWRGCPLEPGLLHQLPRVKSPLPSLPESWAI